MVAAVAESIPGLRVHALLTRALVDGQGGAAEGRRPRARRKVTGTPTLFVGKSGTQGAEVQMSQRDRRACVVAAIQNAA